MPAQPTAAPPAVAPPPGHPRFALFDSLRAIAALGVLAFHVGVALEVAERGVTGPYVQHLDVGVTVFFLLSGFLLYRPFLAGRLTDRPTPRAAAFLRRRALRIFPAYWVALTIAAIVVPYDVWGDPLLYYGLAQVYSNDHVTEALYPAWSLSCEVVFYALLPIYAVLMARLAARDRPLAAQLRRELAVLAVLASASLLLRALLHAGVLGDYDQHENWSKTPFLTFHWFAAGMALAVASVAAERTGRPPRALEWLIDRPLLGWVLAALVFVGVAHREVLPGADTAAARDLALNLGYTAIAALMLVPAVFEGDGRGVPRRVLRWRWLAWLGLVSYGIFLWHVPAIQVLQEHVRLGDVLPEHPLPLFLAAAALATVTLAAASYYLVERPILRFKYRRPLRGRTAPASERASA